MSAGLSRCSSATPSLTTYYLLICERRKTLWPGLYAAPRSGGQEQLVCIKKAVTDTLTLKILWLSSCRWLCLNGALQQITQDEVRRWKEGGGAGGMSVLSGKARGGGERANPLLPQWLSSGTRKKKHTALLNRKMKPAEGAWQTTARTDEHLADPGTPTDSQSCVPSFHHSSGTFLLLMIIFFTSKV